MMQQGGKRTPGEGGDDGWAQPSFVENGVVGIDDYMSLPSTIVDLHDPLMSSAITQLGTLLMRTSESGRVVNRQEKKALKVVAKRLGQLKENCEGKAPNWVNYIERCIAHIKYILASNPSK